MVASNSSMHFQSNCQTPYSTDGRAINLACRKVVQYVSFADRTDDSSGHGTHVAGIAAGSSSLAYGVLINNSLQVFHNKGRHVFG